MNNATEETIVTPTEQNTEEKAVPYSRFAEVNKKAKELESKLTELMNKQIESEKVAEEKKAKAEGDYKTLMDKIATERATEKNKLHSILKKSFIDTLAVKHEMIKPEYVNLFTEEVEMDDTLEIKNADKIQSAFIEFKKNNPMLFKTEVAIPKTDDKKFVPPKGTVEIDKMSAFDNIRLGLMNKK